VPPVESPAYVAAAAPPAAQVAGQPDPSLYAAYPVAPAPKKKMGVALIATLVALVVVAIGVAGVFGVSAIVNYVNGTTTSNTTSNRDDNKNDDDEDEDPDPEETDAPVTAGDVPLCDDAHMEYASQVFGVPVDDIQNLDDPGDPVALSTDIEPVCGYQIVDAPDFSSHIIQIVYFEGTEENAQTINDKYADEGFECSDPNVYESLTGYSCSGTSTSMSMYLYKNAFGDEAPSQFSDDGEFAGDGYIDVTTYIYD